MIKRDLCSDDWMSFEFIMILFTVCCGLISKKTDLKASWPMMSLKKGFASRLHLTRVPVLLKKGIFHNLGFLISRIYKSAVSYERHARGRIGSFEFSGL